MQQRYSRLVIDCNRATEMPDAIATMSETTVIPGNHDITPEAREERIAAIWRPFHDALTRLLDERRGAGRATALVTIHSFTPVYRGVARPWHAGIITTPDRRFADAVLARLRRDPALVVGDNQPYSAKDNVDYHDCAGRTRARARQRHDRGQERPPANRCRCRGMDRTADASPARERRGDRHRCGASRRLSSGVGEIGGRMIAGRENRSDYDRA